MNNAKLWFWVLLDLLVGAAVINLLFFVMPLLGNLRASFTPARTLTVTAQGMTIATPDLAEISFSVVTQGTNPANLSNNNNAKMNAVMQFVSSQNIASSDIATTGYDLEPNYQFDVPSQRNYISGYTLTQTVQVKIHDLTNVANVLAGLAPLGVNQIGGVDFTFNDPNEPLNIARANALTMAQTEAAEMSSEAGARLGPVVNVSENGNVPGPLPAYAEMSAGAGGMAISPTTPTIAPGTQNVTDNVTVTYELE